jgi:hypothetical protein
VSAEPAGAPPLTPFSMRPYWQALAVIAAFAVWPYVIVYAATVIADLNHCTIVDTGPTACLIAGTDRGGVLYDMASMVQVSFVVMPLGILLGFVWLSVLVISIMAYRRKRSGVADATKMDVNFIYYGLTLVGILAIGLATLSGWLPAPVLLLVSFVAIFWIFSFVFAVLSVLRGKAKAK